MTSRLASRIWATFSFYPSGTARAEIEPSEGFTRYRIERLVQRSGELPRGATEGGELTRIETRANRPAPAPALVPSLVAATGHLQYTSEAQQVDLLARSRVAPGALAVLIPITKSESWWALPQDKRALHFQTTAGFRGHTAIGAEFAPRILRRLYHARAYPDSEWDFLTYFEFDSDNCAEFQMLLSMLRSPEHNPEWSYVERETEIWMTRW